VLRASPRRERLQVELGRNIGRWRRVNQMSATELADRASVTRATLRGIEAGSGTARVDSLLAVLIALGIGDTIVEATDPYSSVTGRARIDDLLRRGVKL
jgi:transcriptional regulator with XRE-family HTH domain